MDLAGSDPNAIADLAGRSGDDGVDARAGRWLPAAAPPPCARDDGVRPAGPLRFGPFVLDRTRGRAPAVPDDEHPAGEVGLPIVSLAVPVGSSGGTGVDVRLGAGDPAADGEERIVLAFRPWWPRVAASGGAARLGGAAGGLLADHLLCLDRLRETLSPADLPVLAEATAALVALCLGDGDGDGARDLAGARARGRARVERIIEENIASARLDAARIAALAGISRSALYRMFEGSGGVAAHVRTARLERVRRALADPALAGVPIAEIAERHGLHSTPSFNRAFRRTFGTTPGAVRAGAFARRPAPGT